MTPRQSSLGRTWLFRLLAATLLPLAVLGAAELGLRAAGYGFETDFFVPVDGEVETPNPRFGWRFFPPAVARAPVVDALARRKEASTVRIFVLGGSAALGTPEPAFSFGRILEVMLEERHPGVRFEVLNAAMAAINSHVVLEIGRAALRRDPDILLVYAGNNEVVGPYGPGTVFGRFSGQRLVIRAGIEARTWRLGQLVGSLLGGSGGRDEVLRWRGMEMFLDREVTADDPRLEAVYRHLEANLGDLAAAADRAEVPLVLATVVTGLESSPPFASRHRADLSSEELARWQSLYERGRDESEPVAAESTLRAAAAIDDGHAELRYRLGRVLLRQDRGEEARVELEAARDLDTLRFRADSRIHQAVRRVAANAAGDVGLVEAARLLDPVGGVAADEDALLWEHVHLRFEGNYRLAELFLKEVEARVPLLASAAATATPTLEECAARLAWTAHDRLRAATTILAMMKRPPFTARAGHGERLDAMRREIRQLRLVAHSSRAPTAAIFEAALARRLLDVRLLERYADLLETRGEHGAAVEVWRKLVERVPIAAGWRTRLGQTLARAGDLGAAESELRRVSREFPDSPQAWINLGAVLQQAGRIEQAGDLYRRALGSSEDAEARINLALLLEAAGRPDEAVAAYRRLLREDPLSFAAQRRLAEVLDREGRDDEAVPAYRAALEIDADDAATHSNLGLLLERLGRPEEARAEYLAALAVDPTFALGYFNLGDLLLAYGDPARAVAAYRAGLELRPGNEQARANLLEAVALVEPVDSGGTTARPSRTPTAASP